ncbi:MAG: GNAT family N-acetyltransferase [Deltaproteobacteria bacterium]|nr:GNAT family N-acetyltransferase [Deltaproteobacteria bacterium]
MTATLSTDRVQLEPIVPAHAAELEEALSDPEIYRYLPLEPREDVAMVIDRCHPSRGRRSPDGREIWLNWALRIRASGRCAGRLEATVAEDGVRARIAYLVAPWARGKGHATEACRLVLGHLFEGEGCRVVEATIDTRNVRSIALVERLGFGLVRVVPDADFFKGETSDEVVYRIVRSARSGE